MTARGLLLTAGVLLGFFALFVPLARRLDEGRDVRIDSERLRRTYAALALYESESGGPAPSLALVKRELDPSDLQSVGDPKVGAAQESPFPLDPALPNLSLRTSTRVSWSYRRQWPEARGVASLDPRQGLLADPWLGPLLRINADGSLVEHPRAERRSFAALFGR